MDIDNLAADISAQGVRTVFGIPGSGATLALLDGLEKRDVSFCLTAFEGTAVIIAATVGRLTGRAGVSLSIKGPGLANSVPGLAAAWFEAFPVVHLTEAIPASAPTAQAHKRLDQRALVQVVSKGVRQMPEHGPAFKTMAGWAEGEEPGPVVMELVACERMEAIPAASPPPLKQTDEVFDLLAKAKRPVILLGALALRQHWGQILTSLTVPIFTTAAAKGVIDETLVQVAGVYTGVGGELTAEAAILPEADLVVAIGLTAKEVLATKPFPCAAVSFAAVATLGREGFAFTCQTAIDQASPALEALRGREWGLEQLAKIRKRLLAHLNNYFLPAAVFRQVDEHFAGRVRVVMDTGYFCTIGEHVWQARQPDWCLLSGQGRYMGTALPMSLGAALHDQSVPTVTFLGDGSVGMYLAEASIAVRYRLPLLIVLLTDNAFGSTRTKAIADGLSQTPLIMDGKSWVPTFNALGIPGTTAENLLEVAAGLESWNPQDGPAFLEIPFAPDSYEAMVRGVR